MRILCWNCRGLGNLRAFGELQFLIQRDSPNIVFLMETKCKYKQIEEIKRQLHMYGIAVDAEGKSGGLAMLWQKDVKILIRMISKRFIDTMVEENGSSWRLTGYYGEPDAARRKESWKDFDVLSANNMGPWVCLGDFNEILRMSEQKGGRERHVALVAAFRDALMRGGLTDIRAEGYKFTWARNWRKQNSCRARLDRVCINKTFYQAYPGVWVKHLDATYSDHIPLLFSNEAKNAQLGKARQRGRSRFKFEAMWTKKAECKDIIMRAWNSTRNEPTGVKKLLSTLKACSTDLQNWGKRSFGNFKKDMQEIRKEIAHLRCTDDGCDHEEKLVQLELQLEEKMELEDMMWKQRAKELWLKLGDRNTSFFHGKATEKYKKKIIKGLMNTEGIWCTENEQLGMIICNHFQEVYMSATPSTEDITNVVCRLHRRLSDDQLLCISSPFTADEVIQAVKNMHPLKAPGPDGFPPLFYQQYWEICGNDVLCFCLNVLNDLEPIELVNNTNVVLIPKCSDPVRISQFRPISLCNVSYRILSKVIANRLKGVMHSLISPFQSAFIPGRLITDNILVAHEVHHTIKKKRAGKTGLMSIKLDMAKAFDRVEWDFVLAILSKMGFDEHWVSLIKMCITTVAYTFLLNGEPTGSLRPSRGLRQGDPISPYLFLLCAEVFSALLLDAEACGKLKGIKFGKDGPKITHLLFADDTLLFGQATLEEVDVFLKILDMYGMVSGQRVNFDKSTVMFSPNTPPDVRIAISNRLQIKEVKSHSKYLGLPTVAGRSKNEMFKDIRERIWKKLQGWNEKMLSRAGKEVLIKAVLQAIPSYAMSCFKLPDGLIKDIQSMICEFWWRSNSDRKPVYWVSWENMCKKKVEGGMGFRDLKAFNVALLGKQLWRLLTEPESLFSKIYKAKYFSNSSLFDAQLCTNPSYSWRCLMGAWEELKYGYAWQIGNGRLVDILFDKWLQRNDGSFYALYMSDFFVKGDKVEILIDVDCACWKETLVRHAFAPEDAMAILSIPLSNLNRDDVIRWSVSRNGLYSVRSAYHFVKDRWKNAQPGCSHARALCVNNGNWRKLWHLKLPEKVKIFLWRLCRNAVPSCENLLKRGIEVCAACPWGDSDMADMLHIFYDCVIAAQVWAISNLFSLIRKDELQSIPDWIRTKCSKLEAEKAEEFGMVLWSLWSARNNKIFEGKVCSPAAIVEYAFKSLHEFRSANSFDLPTQDNANLFHGLNLLPEGFVQINFDAAFFPKLGYGGAGMIARDHVGKFIVARSMKIYTRADSDTLESVALRKTVDWIEEYGFKKVCIFGDSQRVILQLKHPKEERSLMGLLIQDSRGILEKKCDWFAIWIRRQQNLIAHLLARDACNLSDLFVNYDSPPDVILPALFAD